MEQGDFTGDTQKILFFISLATIFLSLIGEISVLVSYHFYYKYEKGIGLMMVVSLMYSNLIFSISNLLEVSVIPDTICEIQAFLRNFSMLGILMWTCAIAILSYSHTKEIKKAKDDLFSKLWKLFYGIAFLFAGGITTINILTQNTSSYNGVFCASNTEEWADIISFVAIGSCIILTTFCYLKLASILKRKKIKAKNYLVFPLVICISWIPWIVEHIYYLLTDNLGLYIVAAQLVSSHLQGLLTSIVYGRSQILKLKKKKNPLTGTSMQAGYTFMPEKLDTDDLLSPNADLLFRSESLSRSNSESLLPNDGLQIEGLPNASQNEAP